MSFRIYSCNENISFGRSFFLSSFLFLPGFRCFTWVIRDRTICFLLFVCFSFHSLQGQLLSVSPAFPQDNASIVITVDCSKGNKGLFNYSNTGDVYVHMGVITNLSAGPSGWRYVKFTWGTTDAASRATYKGNNVYEYTISNIRAFFGVPSSETIQKIAVLFRNGSGSMVQRNVDGSDMYLAVYGNAFSGRFLSPPLEPKYDPVPEPVNAQLGGKVFVSWGASAAANLKLFQNGTEIRNANTATLISDSLLVTTGGTQTIKVTAQTGGATLSDSIRFFIAPEVSIQPLPPGVRDGINYEPGDTSVVLVLYAPRKNRVSLLGDFNNWTENVTDQLLRTPDGDRYWIRRSGLTPGTEYAFQYLVDGLLRIGDPYCEKVLDPNNDPGISPATYPSLKTYPTGKTNGIVSVLQTKKPAYAWASATYLRPDKRSLLIYELLLRDFAQEQNWKLLKDTIGYFKRLGVNAIELMPFNEFEGNSSWGYNPSYYFAPDKYYGTETRLKEFIDACHREGIAVIMDIALNHSFGQSPLVQLYFDAANNRPSADNPWFNPVARHAFNVGYDMNHESAATHSFFTRVVEYWLKEYRLDGFRFDLSKGFTQVQTCDANGNNCNVSGWGAYDASRVAIWKRYYDSLQRLDPGCYVILEHFADNSEEKELSDYGMLFWGNLNYNFNEATMGYVSNSNFSGALHTARGWSKPHLIAYMESHDEERLLFKNLNYGASSGFYTIRDQTIALRRNEMAAAFFFSMPGPKMIWQFGEFGYDYSINKCSNGTVNSNCRLDPKPVRWDYLQESNRRRLFDVYRAMLSLRAHPLFNKGFVSDRVQYSLSGGLKWLSLTTDTSNIVVVGNFDVNSVSSSVVFPGTGIWYDYLTGSTFPVTSANVSFTLQPGEYHVYVNRNVTFPVYSVTPVSEIPFNGTRIRLETYPNPLRGQGTIVYEIPSSGKVSIRLFNSTGQQLYVLEEGFRSKGAYRISLPMRIRLSADGILFVQMEYKGQKRVTKVILDKD